MIGPKARVELLALLVLLALGLGLRHSGLLLLAIPLACHLGLGLALAPPRPEAHLSAHRLVHPKRLVEGEPLRVTVEVENRGREALRLVVRDGPYPKLPVVGGSFWAAGTVRPGERLTLSYWSHPLRGVHRLDGVAVEVRDPLGLVPRETELFCPGEAVVLPRHEDLARLELAARRTLPMPGTARSRRGGVGLEFFGVREYQPGDETRRLAWKALARRDAPVVVEYEEERAADVAVILDVRGQAYRGARPELFDHAVRAAAALAQFHLRQGHRVGLLKYGAVLNWVFPGYGRRHGERILGELARAELGESEVFADLAHLPTRLLPAGSLLLLVSPLLPGDEQTLGRLVARGYRALVVVPDPPSAELAAGGRSPEAEMAHRILALERGALLRRARRCGAFVMVWDVRRPLAPLLRRMRGVAPIWP
mgnify:CR=1 FL=1|jgi:uncharacterized protein (DUF58 family)